MPVTNVNITEPTDTVAKVISPYRLIYRSRSKVAATDREKECAAIFRIARRRNTDRGITGALLIYDQCFAQTLEGEETAVRDLYARIEADPRHDTIEMLESGLVADRVFGRWAMAEVGEHGEADIPLLATTTGLVHAEIRKNTPEQERVLTIMRDATRGYGRGY
jgi:Sensors of blue-light using FAD